jgi:ribose transport system ATP-binding protein
MQVRPLDLNRAPAQLSGGNQQKVVLAKTLARGSKVVILDEPTVGVDVGSKSEIYEVIAEIARSGAAVLLISSELPEVINLSHRVYVIQHGVVLAHLEGERINEEVLLRNFFSDPKIKITKEKH